MTYRELSADEAKEVETLSATFPLIDAGLFRVAGAINEAGEVVATQGIMQMAHWEGYWVRKDYRGRPELRQYLSAVVHGMLREAEIDGAFVIALDHQPAVVKAIEEQGGRYVGRLYVIPTKKE